LLKSADKRENLAWSSLISTLTLVKLSTQI
jgi:hypothetical protein